MKNKTIKNIGIMVGTSNLAFASGTSGKGNKIVDEKLEDKNEFKGVVEVLKNIVCENIKHEDLAKDIFSKLYKCTKTENKNLKKNILNYSLNFGIKIKDVKDFFKGKIKIDKDKKNIIVLKKNPIFLPLQDTEEKILNIYKSLLNEECIILELDNNGVVDKLYNTTINEDKKKLSDKIKEKLYDTKELFEEIINTLKVTFKSSEKENNKEKEKALAIIKLLQSYELGFGEHTLNDDELQKVVTALDKGLNTDSNNIGCIFKKIKNNFDYSSTTEVVKFEKGVQCKNISVNLNSGNMSDDDLVIYVLKKEKILLIAKVSDIAVGKIKGNDINNKFYKQIVENITGIEKLGIFIENGDGGGEDKRNDEEGKPISCLAIQNDIKTALEGSITKNFNETSDNSFKKFDLETSIKKVEVREYASCFELTFNNGTLTIVNEIPCNVPDNLKLHKNKMYLVVFKQINNTDEKKTTVPAAIVKNCEMLINNEFSGFEEPKK